jgi:hypothetical protein
VARFWHNPVLGNLTETLRILLLGLFVVKSGGCFIPPPLELEADGGGSNAPEVDEKQTIPNIKNPLTIRQTPPGATPEKTTFTLTVYDPDSSTLYARLFIGGFPYDDFVFQREEDNCTSVNPKGCAIRYDVEGLCDEPVNHVPGPHVLEAYIVDQPWVDTDPDDLRKTKPGGFRTDITWRLDCTEPLALDGGV